MGIIIRQSIKGTIITYSGVFLGFLTTLFLATKFLSSEEIGLTKILLSASGLFGGLALLGLGSSAIRYFPHFKSEGNNKNNGFFFYLIAIPFIGLLIVIPLMWFFKGEICNYLKANSPLFIQYYNWIIPLTCFCVYFSAFETYSSILERIVVPKLIREVIVRLLLISVYLLYAFHVITITGFVTGFVTVYAIAMMSTFFYVSRIGSTSLRHDSKFITPSLRRSFFAYTSLLIIGSLGGSIVGYIDVYMISANINLAATGIYTIALFMVAVIEIPARSISSISYPIVSQAIKDEDQVKINKLFKDVSLHQLLFGSFIFILIWINIDRIYDIIPNGVNYKLGKWVVFYLGVAKLVEVALNFGGGIIGYSKYYIWNLVFVFFLAALTSYTNYIFIPIYGVVGSAFATCITCFTCYSLQQLVLQLKMKVNPFSLGTLKVIITTFTLLGISYLLPHLPNPYLDILFHSITILALGIPLVYFLNISQEVNKLAHTALEFLKIRKPNQNHD